MEQPPFIPSPPSVLSKAVELINTVHLAIGNAIVPSFRRYCKSLFIKSSRRRHRHAQRQHLRASDHRCNHCSNSLTDPSLRQRYQQRHHSVRRRSIMRSLIGDRFSAPSSSRRSSAITYCSEYNRYHHHHHRRYLNQPTTVDRHHGHRTQQQQQQQHRHHRQRSPSNTVPSPLSHHHRRHPDQQFKQQHRHRRSLIVTVTNNSNGWRWAITLPSSSLISSTAAFTSSSRGSAATATFSTNHPAVISNHQNIIIRHFAALPPPLSLIINHPSAPFTFTPSVHASSLMSNKYTPIINVKITKYHQPFTVDTNISSPAAVHRHQSRYRSVTIQHQILAFIHHQ